MKINSREKNLIVRVFFGIMVFFLGVVNANAAPLDLPQSYPDLTTWDAVFFYEYKATGKDPGGVFVIDWDTDNSSTSLNPYGGEFLVITDPGYHLEANFDVSGNFVGGTILATGHTSDPNFDSGTIVSANLIEMGFSGDEGPYGGVGVFEFIFDDVDGDMADFGWPGGVKATTVDLDGVTGDWDSNPDFWKTDFSGTGSVDTFVSSVPIPSAVWLLGSGMIGLFCMKRRRST